MTLTDFLLARIAEDETFWRREVNDLVMGGIAERMLAECEAKREIVRRARRERGRYDKFGDSVGNPIQAVVAWETAVRALAVVYADHPDYREEWKP